MTTPLEDFDLDRYLRASRKVDLTGVKWDEIKDHPVSGAEARALAYMMDIESHTVMYLRELLSTPVRYDPDITAFLSCWVYEELWHGEAFSRFLGEAGFRLDPDRDAVSASQPYPSRGARNQVIRRGLRGKGAIGQVATSVASSFIDDFAAVHMTWGAVNELSTLTGYQAIIAQTEHPVLQDILARVIKDERRHFAFYRAQARLRLERSPKARRLTRFAMERLWAPVGTGVRPQEETDFVIVSLFGDFDGAKRMESMDATIREWAGFEDAHLFRNARLDTLRRMSPRRAAALASDAALERAGIHRDRPAAATDDGAFELVA